jgi:hypothetical protein
MRTFGLDADDFDPVGEPGGDAGNQPAAADRDEDGVKRRQAQSSQVPLPFEPDRSRAGDRLGRIERVDLQRAAFGDIGVAAFLRLGVICAADDGLRAAGADPRDLRGGRDFRDEDLGGYAELLRRIGDGGAMVAARGGGAARGRGRAGKKIVERAARLERAGMLQALKLLRQGRGAGDRRGGFKDRRATDMRRDLRMRRADVGTGDGRRRGGVFNPG